MNNWVVYFAITTLLMALRLLHKISKNQRKHRKPGKSGGKWGKPNFSSFSRFCLFVHFSHSHLSGPPYVLDRPGKLSFSLGPLRFRQPVYDQVRNSEPFVLRPGRLSFRIGPLKFYQIPAQDFHFYPCCVDYQANCYNLVDCNEDH